jgi:hypothetical protein
MARIRTIKPDFWSDDTITECSVSARLLFIGLWNFADDAGNLDRSHKQIKSRVFPVDNIDCEPLILELLAHGLLIEYSVSGKKYLHIPGFAAHQLINRPSKPVVPGFSEEARTPGVLTEPSVTTHSVREGKGRKEGGARSPKGSRRVPADFSPDTDRALAELPDIDVLREIERFRDWEFAKPRTDWAAAWRNWLRTCKDTGKYARLASKGKDNGLPTLRAGNA